MTDGHDAVIKRVRESIVLVSPQDNCKICTAWLAVADVKREWGWVLEKYQQDLFYVHCKCATVANEHGIDHPHLCINRDNHFQEWDIGQVIL